MILVVRIKKGRKTDEKSLRKQGQDHDCTEGVL